MNKPIDIMGTGLTTIVFLYDTGENRISLISTSMRVRKRHGHTKTHIQSLAVLLFCRKSE